MVMAMTVGERVAKVVGRQLVVAVAVVAVVVVVVFDGVIQMRAMHLSKGVQVVADGVDSDDQQISSEQQCHN